MKIPLLFVTSKADFPGGYFQIAPFKRLKNKALLREKYSLVDS